MLTIMAGSTDDTVSNFLAAGPLLQTRDLFLHATTTDRSDVKRAQFPIFVI